MSSIVSGSRFLTRTDRRRAARSRKSRRYGFGLEWLEDRITPTGPTVTGLAPTFGPAVGGTSVTITGTNFTGATAVDFGTSAATNLVVVSATEITANSPSGTGTVDVTVTTPSGTSPTTLADEFTYSPTIASISPSSGPLAGGTTVTITGASFTGATEVDFGSTAATSFAVVNSTTITAVSPAGTGTVDITVTAPSGTSATTPADRFSYVSPPAVSGIAPTSGSLAGGTLVTIIGTGFTGATLVDFGTIAATNLTVVNDTSITVDSPASLNTGTVDVTVTGPGGTSTPTTADQFTYVAGPTVTALNPTSGPSIGGTTVTITGTNFTGATAVDFGTIAATNVNVVSATSITVTSPAGSGTVNVTVTTPGGTSPTVLADEFTYSPTVTSLSPPGGPFAGGTTVTITGTSFAGATAVDFGTTPATSFAVVNSTTITAVSPAGTGSVNVIVTAPTGTSTPSSANLFSYLAAPSVASISPTSGPTTGGTAVTITGTGFTDVSAVDFGTVPAASFSVVGSTTITAISPAGTGVVDVTVTTPGGTSPTSSADLFAYTPTVTGLSPAFGPSAGGTSVTIVGTGFSNVTAVDFGTVAATSITVVNTTTITAVSPAGSGAVDVTVTTASGTSSTSSADVFTYSPSISSVFPRSGPVAGGTEVLITGSNLANATAIDFGTAAASEIIEDTATQIVVISPPGNVSGQVDVTVTTAGGTSPTSPADSFFYASPGAAIPRVTAISPQFGSPAGGTLVTITGLYFTQTSPLAVYFGLAAATDVTVVNPSTITAVSPPGTGSVDVTVYTYGGGSRTTPADVFTYTDDGPLVTSVERYGYHSQPTYLVIYFNSALEPASAERIANYQIVGPNGHVIKVKSARYNATTNAVTLTFGQQLILRKDYRLTINGTTSSGVKNTDGLLLDGASTGAPGSNYVATINQDNLAGPASQRPIAAVLRAKAERLLARVKLAVHRQGK